MNITQENAQKRETGLEAGKDVSDRAAVPHLPKSKE